MTRFTFLERESRERRVLRSRRSLFRIGEEQRPGQREITRTRADTEPIAAGIPAPDEVACSRSLGRPTAIDRVERSTEAQQRTARDFDSCWTRGGRRRAKRGETRFRAVVS